jgi:hypothetical protein
MATYRFKSQASFAVLFVLALVFMMSTILYGPYINIWCFNTLFKCGIEYNWTTWLAMLWFNVSVLGTLSMTGKSS